MIGIVIRWIKVRHRPIGMPANPTAAPFDVEPMITNRKKKVATTSRDKTGAEPVFAGAQIAIAIGSETIRYPARLARCNQIKNGGGDDRADHLRDDVGSTSALLNRPPAHSPIVTAGLKCPPEIWPTA